MAINYISGSSVKNNGGAVAGLSSNGSLVDAVSSTGKSSVDTRAKVSDKVTSITQTAGSAVERVTVVDGSFAFRLPTAPSAGTTLSITSADYPINGVYLVHSVSGMWALTSTPYHVCGTVSASGNYTTSASAATIDPAAQNEDLIVGYTSSIAGSTNTTLRGGGQDPRFQRSVNKFVGYRHWVYTDGYHMWDGLHNACDYQCSGITLGTDEAADGVPTVVMDTGSYVRAAELERPEVSGLRAPAQGTVTITDVSC